MLGDQFNTSSRSHLSLGAGMMKTDVFFFLHILQSVRGLSVRLHAYNLQYTTCSGRKSVHDAD